MNKYLKIFGLIGLLCFSFYYTDQIAKFMRSKDPIYESILSLKDTKAIESVNATIDQNKIIPGLEGSVVNVEKSFANMKNLGFFSESKLVYDEVQPSISLKNNLDKVIQKANALKEGVSLVVDNESLAYFLDEMGTSYTMLVTKENAKKVYAYGQKVNMDKKNYNEVENLLKSTKESSDLCYVKTLEKEFCQKKKKILFEETISLNNSNFITNYHKVTPGSIIYLDSKLETKNIKVLLNQIYFQGLKILPLTELISESRS